GVDLKKLKEEVLRREPDARLLAGFVAGDVISMAKREARLQGHDAIGPEHLLLGLIGHSDGIAGRTMRLMAVDLDNARLAVEKLVERGSISAAEELSFTPETRRLVSLARDEAKHLGHGYLGTEHFMLAILNDEDNIARSVLGALNVDLSELHYEVTSRLVNLRTGVTGEKFLQ
ncbi:MAG: hypothetical protein K2Z81_00475, partial [Cyanobacteria bacterium]|nr:hypothetical protein [Cyanobacteriota bacterium]